MYTSVHRQRRRRLALPSHAHAGPLLGFFTLAYALSWTGWLWIAAAGGIVRQGSALPTHFPGLLGPLAAAFVVTATTMGRPGARRLLGRMVDWRTGWRWWLVAFSPLLGLIMALPVSRVIAGGWPNLTALDEMSGLPAMGVIVIWLALVFNGWGEETGWRGFALPRLQASFSPLVATVILAICWALWHAPLFVIVESYRGFNAGTLIGFFFGMLCGSTVLTWLYNRSGGSVLLVAIWHGTYNLASATGAASGTIAAVVTTLVMIQALVLIALEVRATHAGHPSVLGPRVPVGRTP